LTDSDDDDPRQQRLAKSRGGSFPDDDRKQAPAKRLKSSDDDDPRKRAPSQFPGGYNDSSDDGSQKGAPKKSSQGGPFRDFAPPPFPASRVEQEPFAPNPSKRSTVRRVKEFGTDSDNEEPKRSTARRTTEFRTDSDDEQPRRQTAMSGDSSNSRQVTKRRPNEQYQPPDWTFPEELSQRFDIGPTLAKLKREFSLSVLRDAII
jgi:hypothetical protein